MNISFRQLRLFLALAEHGSVGAAARVMHVTQPTASMQLREVQDAAGLPLYTLVGRRVQLTEAGHALATTARRMLDDWIDWEQQLAAWKGLTGGRLRVAVVSTAKYFVPRLLGGFCARYPDIDIRLEVLNRDGVLQRLREQRDDLAIMSMPPTDWALDDAVFLANPLVLIGPGKHPLAGRASLTLADVAGERFILRERGSGTRMAVDAHFRAVGFQPRVRLELGSNEAIKEAVAGGLGLSVLSAHTLHGRAREHGVQVWPVAGFPLAGQWHVVCRQVRALSPIARVFREHLLSQAERVAADVAADALTS